jgi:hypothetical protein
MADTSCTVFIVGYALKSQDKKSEKNLKNLPAAPRAGQMAPRARKLLKRGVWFC